MGSEYPRRGERRLTVGSVRNFSSLTKSHARSRKSLSSPGSSSLPTPNTRLKKFQKLRDRKNLRQQVLDRNNYKKQIKMLETGRGSPKSEGRSPKSEAQALKDGLLNKSDGSLNGDPSVLNGVENGIEEKVKRSPRKTKAEKLEEPEAPKEEEKVKSSPRRKGRPKKEERMEESEDEEEEEEEEEEEKVGRRKSARNAAKATPPRRVKEDREREWSSSERRIRGRRPLRTNLSPPLRMPSARKRKSGEIPELEEPVAKRTPSVSSPGWRFFSPGALFRSKPVEDSLCVNLSTDTDAADLDVTNNSDDGSSSGSDTPPTKVKPWLCAVM